MKTEVTEFGWGMSRAWWVTTVCWKILIGQIANHRINLAKRIWRESLFLNIRFIFKNSTIGWPTKLGSFSRDRNLCCDKRVELKCFGLSIVSLFVYLTNQIANSVNDTLLFNTLHYFVLAIEEIVEHGGVRSYRPRAQIFGCGQG